MLFQGLQPLTSLLKIQNVRTDNVVFRLHYQVTCVILLGFSILVTAKQYFGDPIDCQFRTAAFRNDFVDSFCWVYSTYTIRTSHGNGGDPLSGDGLKDEEPLLYHKYYQWVSLVLFFQAIFFYIPKYLWNIRERGRLKTLVAGLNTAIIEAEVKDTKIEMLLDYFSMNLRNQDMYAYTFFFSEVLNFINVVCQIYVTDAFLGFEFTTYISHAFDFAVYSSDSLFHHSDIIFPKVTRCDLSVGGFSGVKEHLNGLCVLPLNIINDKIYAFLGLWFIMLSVVSGVWLVYRGAVVLVPKFRMHLLQSRAQGVHFDTVDRVVEKCRLGDWFILYQMGRNIEPVVFSEFIDKLDDRLLAKDRQE